MMTYRGASKALAEATRGAPWVPDYCRVPRCARWSRPDVSSQQLSSATSAARCDDRCTWDLGGICLLSITSRIITWARHIGYRDWGLVPSAVKQF